MVESSLDTKAIHEVNITCRDGEGEGEGGVNRKERKVTPVYANVSQLYTKHGAGV